MCYYLFLFFVFLVPVNDSRDICRGKLMVKKVLVQSTNIRVITRLWDDVSMGPYLHDDSTMRV